jgi:DNA mismatch endonuclease (patch repair protein)
MDKLSAAKRSKNMSQIQSKNTKPEQVIRRYLSSRGVKYRCNVNDMPGKSDIAIKCYKMALDIHGCFWHGHENCKYFRFPKSNTEFWNNKIMNNKERDRKTKIAIENQGFNYFVIWECEVSIKKYDVIDSFVNMYSERKNLKTQLKNNSASNV